MSSVEYLIGSEDVSNVPLPPYSKEAMGFCAELSRRLLKSPLAHAFPDVSALAFWCREANLRKLAGRCPEAEQRLGRGLCFHIAPGNIPINFAFSYLFGLLSGCSNIVRLPSRSFPQTQQVCDAIRETLEQFPEMERRTAFIRYAADNETTARLSRTADARLIWGGDATIAAIRSLPAMPRCVDVCFADRYSICMMDGNAVENADDAAIARLAEGFYNDTYLMDQNACSSPQLILWQSDSTAARDRFWRAARETAEKKYRLQAAVSVDKYTRMFEDVLDGRPLLHVSRSGNLLYRAELGALEGDLTELRGKGGYFYEYALPSLAALTPCVTEKFQTLTYFGHDPAALRAWVADNRLRGIDRIVPVGKAMDIGIFWDGFDLARTLSRAICLE